MNLTPRFPIEEADIGVVVHDFMAGISMNGWGCLTSPYFAIWPIFLRSLGHSSPIGSGRA